MAWLLYASALVALLVVGALVALAIKGLIIDPLRLQRFYRLQGITGRSWKPLFGDIPWIARFEKVEEEAAVHPWRDEHRKHGQIFTFFYGPMLRLHICDPVALQSILMRHDDSFIKPPLVTSVLAPVVGSDGIFTVNRETHKHQRLASNSAFVFSGLQAMVPLMQEVSSAALQAWLRTASGLPVYATSSDGWVTIPNVVPLASSLTLGIIGRAAFPTLQRNDDGKSPFSRLSECLDFIALAAQRLYIFIPSWHLLPLPGNAHLREGAAAIRTAAEDVVRNAQVRFVASCARCPPVIPSDPACRRRVQIAAHRPYCQWDPSAVLAMGRILQVATVRLAIATKPPAC